MRNCMLKRNTVESQAVLLTTVCTYIYMYVCMHRGGLGFLTFGSGFWENQITPFRMVD